MSTVRTTYLPQVTFTAAQLAPRDTLVRTAQPVAETLATLAADNAPLRVLYGRVLVGAQVVQALAYQGKLVLVCRWGKAPIDAIEQVFIDDAAAPASVTVRHYLGGPHAPDATLVAAWAAQSPPRTYADAPQGTAYSVLVIPPGLGYGFPRVSARIRGRKLYDDRTGLTVWSDNPALAVADFARDTTGYGMGLTVDSSSVIAAANACDELVVGEKRRTFGLAIEEPQDCGDWLDTLRTYAGCLIDRSGDALRLIPDRPAAVAGTLDSAAGQIRALRSLKKRGLRNVPTVMTVIYTDTTTTPWREARVTVKAAGVDSGAVDWRPSDVPLPGIQRRSQAVREATERLNHLTLEDLTCEVEAFDEALVYEIGDILQITHPVGLDGKRFRILGIGRAASRPVFRLVEYDPAVYSNAIVDEPTWTDTTLPTPSSPPAPTALVLAEEGYTTADGATHTRIRATWGGVTYAFLRDYRITVRQGAAVLATLTSATAEARTGALQEGLNYQIDVQTISTAGIASAVLSAALMVTGAGTPPPNVTSWITALEAGGRVILSWLAPAGVTRFRLAYGPTAGSYATATRIDDFDGSYREITTIPAGTWRFYLVALSRAGLESAVPLTRDITVTLDSNVLITEHTFTTPTLTNLTANQPDRTAPGWYITDFGDGIGFGHADTNNSTGTFADLATTVFAHPHTAGTSTFETESWDFGAITAGAWAIDVDVTDLAGTATVELRLSDNGSSWTDHAWTGTPVQASGRFLRARVSTSGTMQVGQGARASVVVAKRRDPNGGKVVTTSASGPTTVTLAGKYVLGAPLVSLRGSAAGSVRWDNLTLGTGTNSFDIYAFDAGGSQIAADVAWTFEGI